LIVHDLEQGRAEAGDPRGVGLPGPPRLPGAKRPEASRWDVGGSPSGPFGDGEGCMQQASARTGPRMPIRVEKFAQSGLETPVRSTAIAVSSGSHADADGVCTNLAEVGCQLAAAKYRQVGQPV
jgi:hypothetical protein